MVIPGCNCELKPFAAFISTCPVGHIAQMVGVALVAFTIGAGIYYGRYWWMVSQAAEAELDRVFH